MICFELYINGRKIATAGISTTGVVSAILCLVTPNRARKRKQELDLSLGGLEQDEYLKWCEKDDLKIGDEVTVRIIKSESCDEPSSRYKEDPKMDRKRRKEYYKELKKEFEKGKG
jgi:hypothetical protein